MRYSASQFETNRTYFEDSNIGKISFGHIKKINIEKGAVTCDVVDTHGNLYNRCGILGYGADEYNWSSFPLYPDMGVIFIPTGYNSGSPVIIGSTFRPRNISDDFKGFNNKDEKTANNSDHTKMSVQDYIAAVGNATNNNYLQITPENGVILETENNVRIQLPEDGILRISSNRQIIDEPLNGQQFINVITPVFKSLEAINRSQGDVLSIFNNALQSVSTTLTGLGSGPQAALPVTNAQLAGYFLILAEALATSVADLASTNFEYDTLEMQDILEEFKPKMEATINRKVKLPK